MNKTLKKLTLCALFILLISIYSCSGGDIGNPFETDTGSTVPETTDTASSQEPQEQKVTQYLPEEPENAQIPQDGIYIVYAVNSSDAGKIKGETKQEVSGGKSTVKVTAEVNCTPKVRQCDIITNKRGERYGKGSTQQEIYSGV